MSLEFVFGVDYFLGMALYQQLILSEDGYLTDQHLRRVLKKLQGHASDVARYSGKTHKVAEVLEAFDTPSLFASEQIFWIESFDEFSKKDLESFSDFIEKRGFTSDHCFLTAKKLDKRTKLFKTLKKSIEVVELKKPYPNQLAGFLLSHAKDQGLNLKPDAAQALVDQLGSDLRTLVSEIDKLALYVAPEKAILKKHVLELTGQNFVDNVWLLTTAIGQKNYQQSFNLMKTMFEQGESAIYLVALVVSHFRKLILACEFQSHRQGFSDPIEKVLGVHPFFVKDYQKQAQKFQVKELHRLYHQLMKLAEDLRSVRIPQELLFSNFLQRACFGK